MGRQDQRGVELGEHRDCRAQAQARQEANREAEGVEKREDAVEDFGPFVKDRHPRDRFLDVGHEVGVRERGGLRNARRSARVDQESHVIHGRWAAALPGGGRAHRARPGAGPVRAGARELIALLARCLHRQLER